MTGNGMRTHYIYHSSAGFAVLKDHEVKKMTIPKYDVSSVDMLILTMHISKVTITLHAKTDQFKSAHSIERII
jgi:Cu/Ag efflux protein CusF